MRVLIVVEHNNQRAHANIKAVLAGGLQLDTAPTLLVIGHDCRKVAEEAAKLAGAGLVLMADNPCYEHQLAENTSKIIAAVAQSYDAVLAASSTFGKNVLPRAAAILDVSQVSDVCAILDENTFVHPVYAGNAIETVKSSDKIKILTLRETAFTAIDGEQNSRGIETLDLVIEETNTQFIKHELSRSLRPDLSSAKIVVSGGRGLQSAEKFKLIEALADTLGAAVGASRAAVDAGFVPNEYQVGQTGRIIAPDLYIAIGISGAIQHLAGMKDSKVIVAINKDEDAPIFQIADYGLVGDLFTLVPELIDELTKRKSL